MQSSCICNVLNGSIDNSVKWFSFSSYIVTNAKDHRSYEGQYLFFSHMYIIHFWLGLRCNELIDIFIQLSDLCVKDKLSFTWHRPHCSHKKYCSVFLISSSSAWVSSLCFLLLPLFVFCLFFIRLIGALKELDITCTRLAIC